MADLIEERDKRFPSPPYYVSKECKLIPEAVDKELTRLDTENERVRGLLQRYGNHEKNCDYFTSKHEVTGCSCGFAKASKAEPNAETGGEL